MNGIGIINSVIFIIYFVELHRPQRIDLLIVQYFLQNSSFLRYLTNDLFIVNAVDKIILYYLSSGQAMSPSTAPATNAGAIAPPAKCFANAHTHTSIGLKSSSSSSLKIVSKHVFH